MIHAPASARRAHGSTRAVGAALAALLLGAALSISSPQVASAAPGSFTVDDPIDAVDANTGDGICSTVMGTCTVRAAVQEANARGGSSEVTFSSSADNSTLSLSGPGGAEVGDLEIASGVTVRLIGNVPARGRATSVSAMSLGDRHVHVLAGGRLELQTVSLVGGATSGDGGAILNEGQVLITNTAQHSGSYVALANNSAAGVGGAVANLPGAQFTISDVANGGSGSRIDVSSNVATGDGGAIHNAGGSVDLQGSTLNSSHDIYVDSNSTSGNGGGITNTSGGSVLLGCRSYVRFSSAVLGGGVYNENGQLTMAGGGLHGDSATHGGALYNADDGQVTVTDDASCQNSTTIGSSWATGDGGAMATRGSVDIEAGGRLGVTDGAMAISDASVGGGVWVGSGSLDVAGLLSISGTSSSLGGGGLAVTGGVVTTSSDGQILVSDARSGGNGGGVAVSGGTLAASVLIRSNNAVDSGGGMYVTNAAGVTLENSAILENSANRGGGLANVNATVDAVNTTIAANFSSGPGGGVHVDGGTTTLRHVSVIDNSPDGVWSNSSPQLQRVLMAINSGQNCTGVRPTTGDFNVFDDASCSPTGNDLTDTTRYSDVGNRLDGDVRDGATTSYDPTLGNPAIDWVTDTGCGDPEDDQLGAPRPTDGDGLAHCDAGAIEAADSGAVRSISGTLFDEVTQQPLQGACVFTSQPGGDGDGVMAMTGTDGSYTSNVSDGVYLMAFFVPLAGGDGCEDSGIDPSYQPEWYSNVPVQFRDDGSDSGDGDSGDGDSGNSDSGDGDVVFPDLAEVTLVEVDGANVIGIDACLGAGPGAGLDAPCGPQVPAVPKEAVDLSPAAPPSPGETRAEGAAIRAASARPSALAFTGVGLVALWWGLAVLAAGIGLVGHTRRRRCERATAAVAANDPGAASFR